VPCGFGHAHSDPVGWQLGFCLESRLVAARGRRCELTRALLRLGEIHSENSKIQAGGCVLFGNLLAFRPNKALVFEVIE
jgi:hypothetical protein